MNSPQQSRDFGQIAASLTRVDDALALYDEPVWRELRQALVAPQQPLPEARPATKEWFRANPQLLAKEKAILEKLLSPLPEIPGLFFQKRNPDLLGVAGLLTVRGATKVKVELLFPEDYPQSPPRLFFFGPAIKKAPRLLRADGSIPVPFGADQQWKPSCNSGMILNWALEWFEANMEVVQQRAAQGQSPGRPLTRLKPTGPMYGESIEEYERRLKQRLPQNEEER